MTTVPDAALAVKYRVFASLWAVCLLFDLSGRGMASTPTAALATAGAVGVLILPRSTALLAACGASYVANVLTRPGSFVYVHWYFDALVGSVLALGWLERAIRRRTLAVGEADLLAATAPAGRTLALLAIGFAGFSKLNTMFLDPANSCGAALYLAQSHAPVFRWFLPDATWARATAIGLTLAAELAAPLMVLSRRLRPLAFVVATPFFFLLGINPVGHLYEFAGPMLALLLLFCADELPARIATRLGSLGPIRRLAPWRETLRWTGAAVLVLAVTGSVLAGETPNAWLARTLVCRTLWWIGVPALLGLYLWNLPPVADRLRFAQLVRGGALVAWIVPALMLANESLTYLGFTHNMTFTMASDLRAQGGRTNHVLVTPPILPGNRPVEILRSNDAFLRLVKKEDARLPWVSLRHQLRRNPNARVTFRIEGQEPETVERAADDPRFGSDPFLGKLLFYTEQPMDRRCAHWDHASVRGSR